MDGEHRTRPLATLAGWLAAAVVAVPVAWPALLGTTRPGGARLAAWLASFAVFAAAFLLLDLREHRRDRLDAVLVALACAGALGVSAVEPRPFGPVLLVVLAALLAARMSLGRAILASAALTAVAVGLLGRHWPAGPSLVVGLAYLSLEIFAAVMITSADRERQARESVARAHAELRAAQSLLVDSGRAAERVRIARDLHDLLGHHLTALSLNLEVASHLADGEARVHVERAQALTRLLLGDVRTAVSELRAEETFDLAHALRETVGGIPRLAIDVEAPDELRLDDVERAQALLRAAQEIVTNTLRHAGASRLTLRLGEEAGGLVLRARDDGRDRAPGDGAGSGLAGLAERMAALGGRVSAGPRDDGGWAVDVWLPRASGERA